MSWGLFTVRAQVDGPLRSVRSLTVKSLNSTSFLLDSDFWILKNKKPFAKKDFLSYYFIF
jgi:hypothetical protein